MKDITHSSNTASNGIYSITLSETSISAYWMLPNRLLISGIISADLIKPKEYLWWINRAIINKPALRNLGIGSTLLKSLLEEITKKDGKKIVVMPGGYGEDIEKQYNFYKKNGFISDIFDNDPCLSYTIKD